MQNIPFLSLPRYRLILRLIHGERFVAQTPKYRSTLSVAPEQFSTFQEYNFRSGDGRYISVDKTVASLDPPGQDPTLPCEITSLRGLLLSPGATLSYRVSSFCQDLPENKVDTFPIFASGKLQYLGYESRFCRPYKSVSRSLAFPFA